jgi:hypothetical protein
LWSVSPLATGQRDYQALRVNITINGAGADVTIIERDPNLPFPPPSSAQFRIFHVGTGGTLSLNKVTIRGGSVGQGGGLPSVPGGGIANRGTLAIHDSVISDNSANVGGGVWNFDGTVTITSSHISNNDAGQFPGRGGGGGIFSSGGTVTITDSTVSKNSVLEGVGGGILNQGGTMSITNSTISDNRAIDAFAAGIANSGTMTIINSTVSGNLVSFVDGAGIRNSGTLTIVNSTISLNRSLFDASGAGIQNLGQGSTQLENTIVALNTRGLPPGGAPSDCSGTLKSLGNNLIGDPTGCNINLQSADLTGDPGLGAFVDDGAPGHGRFPLLATSQAVNAGSDNACPPTDQLDTPRRGTCDIGAIEFYPVVNDLVALTNLTTAFDPTPMPGGPAGTFRITADFTNTSNQAIVHPFAEVVELTGGNLLLNADGGAGGVGARLTPPNSASTPLLPGVTETFQFIIGLQTQGPFTFFANMLGDSQLFNQSLRCGRSQGL